MLGVDDDAQPEVIKAAYRTLAKSCHPDFLGNEGHNICILLNEVLAAPPLPCASLGSMAISMWPRAEPVALW